MKTIVLFIVVLFSLFIIAGCHFDHHDGHHDGHRGHGYSQQLDK